MTRPRTHQWTVGSFPPRFTLQPEDSPPAGQQKQRRFKTEKLVPSFVYSFCVGTAVITHHSCSKSVNRDASWTSEPHSRPVWAVFWWCHVSAAGGASVCLSTDVLTRLWSSAVTKLCRIISAHTKTSATLISTDGVCSCYLCTGHHTDALHCTVSCIYCVLSAISYSECRLCEAFIFLLPVVFLTPV